MNTTIKTHKRHPIFGLLMFLFHNAKYQVLTVYIFALAIGAVTMMAGMEGWIISAVFAFTMMPLMYVFMNLVSKDGKLERYQIAMPITRGEWVAFQFMAIIILAIVGKILLLIYLIAINHIRPDIFQISTGSLLLTQIHDFGNTYVFAALTFILACTKFGKQHDGIILFASMMVAAVLSALLSNLAHNAGFASYIISITVFTASVLLFVVAYFITRAVERKADF